MSKSKDCIVLVDDNPLTNFYNKKLIHFIDPEIMVVEMESSLQLLQYLKKEGPFKQGYCRPNIIFLDINMPKMDGFEFLDHYDTLSADLRKDILIVLLSTSVWSKDQEKAFQNDYIYDLIQKPLSEEAYHKIATFYHENYLV